MRRTRPTWLIGLAALAIVPLACGDDDSATDPSDPTETTADAGDGGDTGIEALTVDDRLDPEADPTVAGEAISEFGVDVFAATRGETPADNVTISPASIAIALAMVEPGATGEAQEQFRTLLAIDDPTVFHASMNALEQDLESRVPDEVGEDGEDGEPGEVVARVANAAYLQEGYPFKQAYLDAVGQDYGPVLNAVDFRADPDAVADEINAWVAEATEDRIEGLIADGVIQPDTVLALVNALYPHASWVDQFDVADTDSAPFTLLDGGDVDVDLMHGSGRSSARGDGWVGATKPYVGDLEAQFILPDEGRFDDVAADLGTVFTDYDAASLGGAALAVPVFETRTTASLGPVLQDLGLTAPFEEGGLLGIADDDELLIGAVLHETFVSMDEEGTEAAAATVVLMEAGSAPQQDEPVEVTLDRPFIYRIVDTRSGATLFLGQVTDPTA